MLIIILYDAYNYILCDTYNIMLRIILYNA